MFWKKVNAKRILSVLSIEEGNGTSNKTIIRLQFGELGASKQLTSLKNLYFLNRSRVKECSVTQQIQIFSSDVFHCSMNNSIFASSQSDFEDIVIPGNIISSGSYVWSTGSNGRDFKSFA